MMVLSACNTSASIDIDTAKVKFKELSLSNFPGENVSSLSTLALKYFKIMQAGHYLPEHLSTERLLKCAKTQTEMFNRKVLTQYSTSDELEREYALKDQSLMRADSRYDVFGPIGCCGFLQEEYGKLFSQKRREVTTSILPQGNLTPTNDDGI